MLFMWAPHWGVRSDDPRSEWVLKELLDLWAGEQRERTGFLVSSVVPRALWQQRSYRPCSQCVAGRPSSVAHGWMGRSSLSLRQAGTALLSVRSWGRAPQRGRWQRCPLRFGPARCPTRLAWSRGACGPPSPTAHRLQALEEHAGMCWRQGADRVTSFPILSLMESLNPKKKAK